MRNLITTGILLSFLASPAFAAPDISVATDPVGKLNQLTTSVRKRAKELEDIAKDLDKVSAEIDEVEKLPPKSLSKEKFADIEKRFQSTIKRSEDLEKVVKGELDKTSGEIVQVRKALDTIATERKNGAKPASNLSDEELKECNKNLNDLEKTVVELKAVLSDKDDKDDKVAEQPAKSPAKKSNKK